MKRRSILFVALCTLFFYSASGQRYVVGKDNTLAGKIISVSYANPTQAPSYIDFQDGTISQKDFYSISRELFHMQFSDSWKLIRTDRDDLNMNHHRIQQYYNGVLVEQGEFILHERNSFLVSANGFFFDGLNLGIVPAYSESQALDAALEMVNAQRYKWEMPAEESLLKETERNNKASYFPKGQLVITNVHTEPLKPVLKLAYKFDIYADSPLSRQYVYVDAQTCKIIKSESRICEFIANGTLATKYSGTKIMVTDSVSPGSFRLRDISRGGNVETYNMNSGTNYGTSVDFTDSDNIWNTILNQDNAAYDAHYGAQMTYDYYLSMHNRNSYDNLGSPIRSYVHFYTNYNNAFWNGSMMSYGDGNGAAYSALTSLDICSHELTHGVTENSSSLIFSYESGALNESFSDIFAACVDFFADSAVANFQIGEHCYTPGTPGDAIRNMNNPNLNSHPDTYLGNFWYNGPGDYGGVHTNSGVQNFWFYLLCVGGTGTNDLGFNYNVLPIGIADAGLIAYRNNNYYLTSGSQYADARAYSILAAGDLFGPCSAQQLAVKNAWDAVGVIGGFSPLPAVTSFNSGPVCPGENISLTSSGGSLYSWTGPGGFSSFLQNPIITGVTGAHSGIYTVTVSDSNGCTTSKSTLVEIHPEPVISVSSPTIICAGDSINLSSNATATGIGGPPVSVSNTTVVNIPDNNPAGIVSTITVVNAGSADKVLSVTIDSLVHTWISDLRLYLIAPDNSQIILASNVGDNGEDFLHTVFSSSANNVIGTSGNNASPFTGIYAPQTPFANLTGPAGGQWMLKMVDTESNDVGILFGWTLTLSGPNGISMYSWSPVTGLNATTIQNPVASPMSTTIYTVTATDFKGCTASATTSITINAPVVYFTVTPVICFGNGNGAVNLNISGGNGPFFYDWSNGSTTEDIVAVGAGNYTVIITDNSGCTQESLVSVSEPDLINLVSNISNPSCNNPGSGSISLSVNGGIPPYNFVWSDGNTGQNRTSIMAGNYSVTVADGNGCQAFGVYTIIQPPALSLSAGITDVSCRNGNNGAIDLVVAGGSAPFYYLWSNGSTTQDLTNVIKASYTVTVTDANGCSASKINVVSQPASVLSANISKTNVRCKGAQVGVATVNATGGTSPYNYLWNTIPAKTTKTITGLAAGSYNCLITDFNGCTKSITVVISEPAQLVVLITKTNVTTSGGSDGTATAMPAGGTGPYAYVWNTIPLKTTATITGLSAGIYSVKVTDSKGCYKIATITITQPSPRNAGGLTERENVIAGFTVYPNPTEGFLHIKLQSVKEEYCTVLLIDITGREIFTDRMDIHKGLNHIEMNLSGFSSGIYMLLCRTTTGQVRSKIVLEKAYSSRQ